MINDIFLADLEDVDVVDLWFKHLQSIEPMKQSSYKH